MNGVIGYVQTRREPTANAPHVFFAERNVRPVEPIAFNDAPDPPRSSDFNTRPSKMPKVVFTNIAGIESVMQDEFGYPLWAPDNAGASVYQAMGTDTGGYPSGQEPFGERVNIQDPQSMPFGSMMMLPSTTDDVLFPVGEWS
jgi:hypothetical protein